MSSLVGPSLAAAHSYAIDVLVQETKRPLEEVAGLYIRELTRLQAGARIQDYLVLLTSRRVRERLRGEKAPRILAEASAFNPLPDGELV